MVFDFGQLVWCWPEYVVTDDSCFNPYEVVGASYVVVGLADAMDGAMVFLLDSGRQQPWFSA